MHRRPEAQKKGKHSACADAPSLPDSLAHCAPPRRRPHHPFSTVENRCSHQLPTPTCIGMPGNSRLAYSLNRRTIAPRHSRSTGTASRCSRICGVDHLQCLGETNHVVSAESRGWGLPPLTTSSGTAPCSAFHFRRDTHTHIYQIQPEVSIWSRSIRIESTGG